MMKQLGIPTEFGIRTLTEVTLYMQPKTFLMLAISSKVRATKSRLYRATAQKDKNYTDAEPEISALGDMHMRFF